MATEAQAMALARLNTAFTPHRPIDLPEYFAGAGRLNLLYRAIDAANTSGLHIILFGDRGTGKTSIAHVLAYNVQEPKREDGRRAILISCSSSDDYSSIWRKVSQEILVKQRQLGFLQETLSPIIGRLDTDENLANPNDVRLFVQTLSNPSVIILDEFDRVTDPEAKRLMADTIKLFSDTNVNSTLVLVGVAESVGDLLSEHHSIARCTAQIKVEPMSVEELSEIIRGGFQRANLEYEENIDLRIAHLSQGYPHYTHLLGLWSGRRTIEQDQSKVTGVMLEIAIPDGLENATGGVQHEYLRAVASSRPHTLFKEVLLACALAPKDSLGQFSATDVRQPLRTITGQDYSTGAYQSHLAKFCEAERGPVLKKTGNRRNYRWQFINPQLIPYVLLEGRRTKLIEWMTIAQAASPNEWSPPS